MATFSGSGRDMDTRSGGKIVSKKRRRPTTPYDRPPPPPKPEPQSKSPNWFTTVIFPATRKIASGAAKVLSAVFDSDNSEDSSSSLASSDSEGDNDDDNYNELDDLCGSDKDHEAPTQAMQCTGEVHQLSTWKSETKYLIERLLMQESYSREEGDRLIQIINSRVTESTVGRAEAGLTTDMPDRTIHNGINDLSNKAIDEARKWLEEKKVGSSPVSDGADVSCDVKSVAVERVHSDVGSPVDVAKVYMNSRPPWTSPSAEHIELQTPSPTTNQLPRGGTLFPVGGESLPSFKQRTSLASGSWNIQEELRRVRLKATEDLLQSPSKRIDLSSFALSPRSGQDSFVVNLLTVAERDKGNELTSLTGAKPINLSANDAATGSSNGRISAVEMGNGLANEGVMSTPARRFEQYQDSQAVKSAGECAAPKLNHPANPDVGMEQSDESAHANGSRGEETRNFNGTHVNGLPTSQASYLAEEGSADIPTQMEGGDLDAVKGHEEKEKSATNMEDRCEILSEASIEVPVMHETDGLSSFGQTNSSMRHDDESPWMLSQPDPSKLAGKPDATVVKQDGRKIGRYNRKGRGRVKS